MFCLDFDRSHGCAERIQIVSNGFCVIAMSVDRFDPFRSDFGWLEIVAFFFVSLQSLDEAVQFGDWILYGERIECSLNESSSPSMG